MARLKTIFAVLALTAIVGVVPQAHAATVNLEVVIAGSSAMWQTLALGAYNDGTSIASGGGTTCHWTSGSNKVNLTDSRTTTANNDPGTLWVVWDNNASGSTCLGDGVNAATNVWAYLKVDSVVGVRCYLAVPKCTVTSTTGNINVAGAGKISTSLWGSDFLIPSYIQPAFVGPTSITVGATDIRPEDALFATCRVNSKLGASAVSTGSDNLDGLGYNTNNNAGECPTYNISTAQAKGLGSPILSAVSILEGGSTVSQANVLAFTYPGTGVKDPISGSANTAAPTVTNVGAAPIIFVTERDKGKLNNVTNATEQQLQAVFSGASCDGSAFTNGVGGGINVFLREPLSGTMNTTEATVFRYPTAYPTGVLGASQETGVNPGSGDNPLNKACGSGNRWRAVGTGEEVAGVLNSGTANFNTMDGIGYTFFSYGNVSSIAGATKYGYLQLNGVDPIFQSYSAGTTIDAGQPAVAGELPLNTPCGSGASAFPCPETTIWGNGFSFPNLRNGTYRAWSLLRVMATGTASTNVKALVTASNKYVVTSVPDYVPAVAVPSQGGIVDVGLKLLRSHYLQKDGAGVTLGGATILNTGADKGGDMGGMIIPTTIGSGSTTNQPDARTQLIQSSDSSGGLGPVKRP
jgi:hypothetical protein